MSTDPEIRYKSAEYMRGIADGMTDVSGEELLRRAEQYRRAAKEYDDAGDYLDAREQSERCNALVRELCEREVSGQNTARAKNRRRHTWEIVCLALIFFAVALLPLTLFLSSLENVSAESSNILWTAWIVVAAISLVIGVFGFFTRDKGRRK
ncbi:MAG: hypothetical protein LBN02_09590 [Oscillospiraceae bacterium]|jgi:hypothetical protein|nr:hypothetical protein [Oscillospiraceae bacterium]